MTAQRNLVGELWAACCPICPNEPEMLLNMDDYWECPECHLQIRTCGTVDIMPTAGTGQYNEINGCRRSAMDATPMMVGRIAHDFRS